MTPTETSKTSSQTGVRFSAGTKPARGGDFPRGNRGQPAKAGRSGNGRGKGRPPVRAAKKSPQDYIKFDTELGDLLRANGASIKVDFDGCDMVTTVTTSDEKSVTLAAFLKGLENKKVEEAFKVRKMTVLSRMEKLGLVTEDVEAASNEVAMLEALKEFENKEILFGNSDNFRSYCRSQEKQSTEDQKA